MRKDLFADILRLFFAEPEITLSAIEIMQRLGIPKEDRNRVYRGLVFLRSHKLLTEVELPRATNYGRLLTKNYYLNVKL